VVSQVFNFWLLWLLVGDLPFAAVIWLTFRVFALWINMIQNYWTHDRKFGYRRYDDEHDNAMNIGEWLPVTATMKALGLVRATNRGATLPKDVPLKSLGF